eukprot:1161698-Pelagomonas_calceolata.AAC.16
MHLLNFQLSERAKGGYHFALTQRSSHRTASSSPGQTHPQSPGEPLQHLPFSAETGTSRTNQARRINKLHILGSNN